MTTVALRLLWHAAPCGSVRADAAEQGGDPGVEAVQQRVRSALGLPPDHRVSFVDLHDAMTSMQTHGKAIPEGTTGRLLCLGTAACLWTVTLSVAG